MKKTQKEKLRNENKNKKKNYKNYNKNKSKNNIELYSFENIKKTF
jgi:hypothetical protein